MADRWRAEGDTTEDPLAKKLGQARDAHRSAMGKLERVLRRLELDATSVFLDERVVAEGYDLVIALGGDGTVLHASHQIGETPVLAINSAPQFSVGFLTSANIDDVGEAVTAAIEGRLSITKLQRMAMDIDGKRVYGRVLNDVLFSHACPASTARYLIRLDDIEEEQMSSGIWLGPAAGSTAAQRSAGGKVLPPRSRKLQFIVREPYSHSGTRYQLVKKLVPPGHRLTLRSIMDAARLYIDGPHVEVPLKLGQVVEFYLSEEPLRLLGFRGDREPLRR